ncbi:hypothetical protein CYJ36_11870 [Bacillus sp. UMB0893]|nr:hypothetical protein CYJ36_11870 [Bacillus sp. UMB0893]
MLFEVRNSQRVQSLSFILLPLKTVKVGEMIMAMNEIDIHRQMLLDAAKEHGLNSSETVRCSQELDALILKQMKKHLSDLRHSQSA